MSNMNKKPMTPAEIERATVERCANLCEVRAGYHAGGNEYRQWESKDCADALRALPPMFVDVPAVWPMEEQPDGSVNQIDPADMGLTPTAGQAAAPDHRDEVIRLVGNALENLYATVKGDCPSLLDDLSDGNSALDMDCSDAIEKFKQYRGGIVRTCSDERPCVNCFSDNGQCLGAYPKAAAPTAGQAAAKDAQDAARYRWLRDALSDRSMRGRSHHFCSISNGHPEELDAAIDAAIAAAPEVK